MFFFRIALCFPVFEENNNAKEREHLVLSQALVEILRFLFPSHMYFLHIMKESMSKTGVLCRSEIHSPKSTPHLQVAPI